MRLKKLNQHGGIRGVLVFATIVLSASVIWQLIDRKTEEANIILDVNYISPQGEVQVSFPQNWTIGEGSFEDEGYYSLELEGPRNKSINRLVKEKYDIDLSTADISSKRLGEIFEDPLTNDYIFIIVDIGSSGTFQLPKNREVWKNGLLRDFDVTSNVSYGKFDEITINGDLGYRYTQTIIDGEHKLETLNYFLLNDAAQVDVTAYPLSSNYIDEAETIVKMIDILSRADLENFITNDGS